MPVWDFAKKSVKVFLNFTFGQFLLQPLNDEQIFLTPRGVGCRDLYFNTEKMNSILSERGIPLLICVAYVSELVVCLPSSIEINGIDLVVQAMQSDYSPTNDDIQSTSMFSSVTAAAFAAVKVAHGSTEWFPTHSIDEDFQDEDIDDEDVSGPTTDASGGFLYRVQRLFERLTTTAEKVSIDEEQNTFVDQESKERVAKMMDSIIAQTSIILRKVNVRIECQLELLPGLNRASGIAFSLDFLSVTNQNVKLTADNSPPNTVNPLSTTAAGKEPNDGWSWLWGGWGGAKKNDPAPPSSPPPNGSLSTILHKNVRLEGFDVYWDLWDTAEQHQHTYTTAYIDHMSANSMASLGDERPVAVCPTADNMVASAKLLTLTGVHTARISMRCPLLFAHTANSALGDGACAWPDPWSLFELRLHLDLGSVIICTCPSQFYWLQLLIGQLTHIYQRFYSGRLEIQRRKQQLLVDDSPSSNHIVYNYDIHGDIQSSGYNYPSAFGEQSSCGDLHPNLSASQFVDLDLSNANASRLSPLVDSNLFLSCSTGVQAFQSTEADYLTCKTATGSSQTPTGDISQPQVGNWTPDSRFNLSANLLCLALVAFYEDESVYLSSATSLPSEVNAELNQFAVGPGSRRAHSDGRTSAPSSATHTNTNSDVHSNSTNSNSTSPKSPPPSNVHTLTALPGPLVFFSRLNGTLPRQGKEEPESLCIDRTGVDTGVQTPSSWMTYLRDQFAELAAPRDHLCFVGGLWHFEMCTHSNTRATERAKSVNNGVQLDFGSQLFGILLSECLFNENLPPLSSHSVSSDCVAQPTIVELISFPDQHRASGDKSTRDSIPAVEFNSVYNLAYADDKKNGEPMPPLSANSDSIHFQLSHFQVEVDLSLSDRVHRITDAIVAASEAVSKLLSTSLINDFDPIGHWRTDQKMNKQSGDESVDMITHTTPHISENITSKQFNLKFNCRGCTLLLRFPIPLCAIKLPPSRKHSDLCAKLWSTGRPLWYQQPKTHGDHLDLIESENMTDLTSCDGLAWWHRSLRPEYFRIVITKLTVTYEYALMDKQNDAVLKTPFVVDQKGSNEKSRETDVCITLHSVMVYLVNPATSYKANTHPIVQLLAKEPISELIKITVHLTPPGMQELVEQSGPDIAKYDTEFTTAHSQQVYTYSDQQFEMGIDLASIGNQATQSNRHGPVEWSLWKRAGPQHNIQKPFVIHRNFVQEEPKLHSKQTTYYPGDSKHLQFYRQSAVMHTRLSISCHISAILLHIEQKQDVQIMYLRLIYDLLLWSSLLPNDRRLRATLTRRQSTTSEVTQQSDHRYWFLSDRAPLASIYAHPEAAREAAALEANCASHMNQSAGLHFHPFDSEYSDSGSEERPFVGAMDDVFDAGLDSVRNKFGVFPSSAPNLTKIGSLLDTGAHTMPKIPSKTKRASAHPSRSTRQARFNKRVGSDEDSASDGNEDNKTSVQKQSIFCLQCTVDSVKVIVNLPRVDGTNLDEEDKIVVHATDFILFVECGHNGSADTNYATLEFKRFNMSLSARSQTNPEFECPCLVHFPWESASYPTSSSSRNSTRDSSDGTMFSLVVEHRQSQRVIQLSGIPSVRDDFTCAIRLRDACMLHWPNLESKDLGHDSALPNWLVCLLNMFETPDLIDIGRMFPGYPIPDTLLIQHVHFEHVAFSWSTPDILSPCTLFQPTTSLTAQLKTIRIFFGCESISLAVNTATDATPTTASPDTCTGEVGSVLSRGPGLLIMAFIDNMSLFLFPVYRSLTPPLVPEQPDHATGLRNWLSTVNFAKSDCICVADLDHLELRCFSHMMRVYRKVDSELLPVNIKRIDIRSTNNLFRLHTCADTLVALQMVIESFNPCPSRTLAMRTTTQPHIPISESNPRIVQTKANLMGSPSPVAHTYCGCSPRDYEQLLHGAISDTGCVDGVTDGPDHTPPHNPRQRHDTLPQPRPHHASRPNEPDTSHTTTTQSDWTASLPCGLYPRLSKVPKSPLKTNRVRLSTSPTDGFFIVEPSMVPSKLPTASHSPKVHFKWLPDTVRSSKTDNKTFELRNDHYQPPSASHVKGSGQRSAHQRLFTDPPSLYPRAEWALTLHNFSLEWNLYGGTDFLVTAEHITQQRSHLTETTESSNVRIPPKETPQMETSVSPGNSRIGPGHRFKHDRSSNVVKPPTSRDAGSLKTTSNLPPSAVGPEHTSLKCGRNRDKSKCISIRFGKIYYRHATFPLDDSPRRRSINNQRHIFVELPDPASRHIFNLGSLLIIDQIADSRINQLLYSYSKPSQGLSIPHNTGAPLFRLAIVCWRVSLAHDRLVSPHCPNHEQLSSPPEQSTYNLPESPISNSHELEAKVSCQPLRINLDQITLQFFEEFQLLFITCASQSLNPDFPTSVGGSSGLGTLSGDPPPTDHVHSPAETSSPSAMCEPELQPDIFIRKVTFHPDLPVRLDYHGHHLDCTGGSIQGFLRMLLQLHNAEIVLPRRVYQRGYPNIYRLLEEIVADVRSSLLTQLPQMLATSVGPMHEVTQFLTGFWDLIYQPMQSLYQGSRANALTSAVELSPSSYWHSADLDLSGYFDTPAIVNPPNHLMTVGGGGGFVHGLRSGTRSFSTSTLWATLQLSIRGVRAIQSVAETAYDLVTPGPSLRSRQLRLRQPADLREGFGNAMNAMSRGFQMISEDFVGAARSTSGSSPVHPEADTNLYKGPAGVVGDVLRQIPPTIVAPLVAGCEVTANILGGLRNQLRPDAKLEDEQKWKNTHGL